MPVITLRRHGANPPPATRKPNPHALSLDDEERGAAAASVSLVRTRAPSLSPLFPAPNYISPAGAHFRASTGGRSVMAAKAAAKPSRPVTIKHLAATLAEDHQLTKRAGRSPARRPGRPDHQASQEGRADPDRWSGHPAGAQARRPHGPQSGDRRGHQDQGQQEGRVPRRQGPQDGDLTIAAFALRRSLEEGEQRIQFSCELGPVYNRSQATCFPPDSQPRKVLIQG